MRNNHQDFKNAGGDIVAVGMGSPAMAAHFRDESDIPFRLLVDRTKETYRALELVRGSPWQIYGPPVWIPSLTNMLNGFGLRVAQQDWKQLGGAIVVAPGGEGVFVHRANSSRDNVPAQKLVNAIRKAG